MEIFSAILLILLVARLCAEIAEKYGQPALVGELLAGVLLGYVLHNFGPYVGLGLEFTHDHAFTIITDLGIFFLMLLAGLELRPNQMRDASRSASGIALGGLLLPLALGIGLGWFFIPESDYKLPQMLFVGTAMAITAVPVAVRVLMDAGKLDSKIGRTIVSAAIMDDILSLMLLAVLTAVIKSGELPTLVGMAALMGKVVLFFVFCWILGKYVFPLLGRFLRHASVPEGGFNGLLVMGFVFALLAETLSLHFIIGAFFAGLMFRARDVGEEMYEKIEKNISGLTSGFLAPIFFASIGLHVTFGALTQTPLFTIALLAFAMIGKIIGAGLPAYLQTRDWRHAAAIGTAMNGRGAVELVIVDIAMRANLFDHPDPPPPVIENMFSAIVIMAIITTVITPVALKPLLAKSES